MDVPLTHIFRHKDARKIDRTAVTALMDSIADIGIINPIRVRPVRRLVVGEMADAYECIAGNHRVEAARKLGLETVPCVIAADDDLHAELAMIDENLVRQDLSPAEKASQTSRRKAIYEELHPETVHGGDHGNQHTGGKSQSLRLGDRFTADTAAKTGQSERVVQLHAERGNRIAPDVLDKLKGTHLDKGTYLDSIKKLPVAEQRERVDRALAQKKGKSAKVRRETVATKADAAEAVAAIIAMHVPSGLIASLRDDLERAGAKNIAKALGALAKAA